MLKRSPFPSLTAFLRVLGKALIILLVINAVLLALGVNPVRALVMLNTYDLLGRGRQRLAYPSDFQNGQLPLDALLAAHAIDQPKPPDEYRVVLLGESGIAGWGVPDAATVSAQLTAQGVRLEGRQVVAYNLAYPQPSAARDLLVLDAALEHDPDLIVWVVSPATLNAAPEAAGQNRVFFQINRRRLARLTAEYDPLIGEWTREVVDPMLPDEPGWQRYVALRDQSLLPVWLNSLLYPFAPPDLAVSERRVGLEPAPEQARYSADDPGFREMPGPAWPFLQAGCQAAAGGGADLLIVAEPMALQGGEHAAVNYNLLYAHDLVDRYRTALVDYAAAHGLWLADLTGRLPAERFTDTPTHMDAEGHAELAGALADILREGGESVCR